MRCVRAGEDLNWVLARAALIPKPNFRFQLFSKAAFDSYFFCLCVSVKLRGVLLLVGGLPL